MIIQITAYKCTFCRKVYQVHSAAVIHTLRCLHNPAKMACATCAHLHGNEKEMGTRADTRICTLYKTRTPRAVGCAGWQARDKGYTFWVLTDDKFKNFPTDPDDWDGSHY